jgi:hypothetical protein
MPAKASIPDFKKGKQSKRFFFEKKKQKTFAQWWIIQLRRQPNTACASARTPANVPSPRPGTCLPPCAMLSTTPRAGCAGDLRSSLTTPRTAASWRQVGGDEQR